MPRTKRDRTPWKVTLVLGPDGSRGYTVWSSHGREDLAVRAAEKVVERIHGGDREGHLGDATEVRVSDGTRFHATSYHYQHPTRSFPVEQPEAERPAMWIERGENDHRVYFAIYEKGVVWQEAPDQHRPLACVEVYKPDERGRGLSLRDEAEVSWPSTSDNRPELAAMMSQALAAASAEAMAMNRARATTTTADRLKAELAESGLDEVAQADAMEAMEAALDEMGQA